jgi:hypothetical protein
MDIFPGVLFHMDTSEADPFFCSVAGDVEVSVAAKRKLVLADLVTFGKVGIEVIFSGPPAVGGDLTVGGQAGPNGKLDDFLVQYGQDSGKSQANRAGIFIGVFSEASRAAAKYFGVRQELGVDFKTDDRFVVHGCGGVALGEVRKSGSRIFWLVSIRFSCLYFFTPPEA